MPDEKSGDDDPTRDRDERGRWKAKKLDALFEIQPVDGEEGERLARQQARIFYEIMEWYARQQQPPTSHGDT